MPKGRRRNSLVAAPKFSSQLHPTYKGKAIHVFPKQVYANENIIHYSLCHKMNILKNENDEFEVSMAIVITFHYHSVWNVSGIHIT